MTYCWNINVQHTEVLKNYKLFVQLVFTGDVSTVAMHWYCGGNERSQLYQTLRTTTCQTALPTLHIWDICMTHNVRSSPITIMTIDIHYCIGTLCIAVPWNGQVRLHRDQANSRSWRLPTRLKPFPVAACLMDAWPRSYAYLYALVYYKNWYLALPQIGRS